MDPVAFAAGSALVLALGTAAAALRPAWVVRWPRSVLATVAIATLAAARVLVGVEPAPPEGSGGLALRLALDPSTEPLLPAGDRARALYERAVLDFGDDEIYVIATECPDVFTSECLGAMRRVSDRLVHVPGVRSVRSLVDVTSFRYVPEEDWIEVRPFIEEIPSDPVELEALRSRALADPVYRKTLVSPDARAAALNVSFREMSDRAFIDADIDGQIERLLAEEERDGLRFHIAGRPHAKTHVYRGMLADLTVLIPLALAVAAGVLLLSGSLHAVAVPMLTALVACLWTFAAMSLVERPLTILTGLLAPTLLAIGSVYGVHVVARYDEDLAASDDPRRAALDGLRHVVPPVLLAGFTTVIGFAALLITDVPAVFELGCFSMFGMASITLLSLTAAPAMLAVRRSHAVVGEGAGAFARWAALANRGLDRVLAAVARGSVRHSGRVIFVCAAAVIGAVACIPHIEIDTDYLSYFEENAPVRREFEAVNRLLAGAVPIYVVIEGEGSGAFREPALLRSLESLQERLEGIDAVSRTQSFVETLRVLNRAFHAGDPAEERLPGTRRGVAGLIFMIPKGEAQRYVTVDHARSNLIVRTGEVGSAALKELTRRIEETLADGVLPDDARAGVTGNAILLARSADGIARGQPRTVGLAALAIFVLVSAGLRSLRLGAVAMIPNLVPVALFFGLLGAGVAPLSLPTSLIGSVALGIAIDDTAHYLVRYREERTRVSPEEAVLRCGRSVGRPIAITSAMLFLGFLVMLGSAFATLQEFGTLIGVTMVLCLVTDLVLLPAVLVRLKL